MVVGSPSAVVDQAEALCVRRSCIFACLVCCTRGGFLSPRLVW